jgi:hypothetical protein
VSKMLSVEPRERWAARSMTLRRWVAERPWKSGEPVCELDIDGNVRTVVVYVTPGDEAGVVNAMCGRGLKSDLGVNFCRTRLQPSGLHRLSGRRRSTNAVSAPRTIPEDLPELQTR